MAVRLCAHAAYPSIVAGADDLEDVHFDQLGSAAVSLHAATPVAEVRFSSSLLPLIRNAFSLLSCACMVQEGVPPEVQPEPEADA